MGLVSRPDTGLRAATRSGHAGGVESSDIRVRRAHPDDWAAVREVRLAALADAPDAFASTLRREARRAEPQWRSRITASPWFLAWRGGTPAGLVAAVPDVVPPATRRPQGRAAGTSFSMWVTPQARGHGVADVLVGAVIEHAEEQQARPGSRCG